MKENIRNLETVVCSRCGKQYPKRRKELGYSYCVDCSEEQPVSCVVETLGEGDHTYVEVTILKAQGIKALTQTITLNREEREQLGIDEPELELHTYEDLDEIESTSQRAVHEIEYEEGEEELYIDSDSSDAESPMPTSLAPELELE